MLENNGFKVLGFFVDKDGDKTSAWDVYIAIDNEANGYLESYAPIGQHSSLDEGYMNSCERITKEEYLAASGHLFTPADYLVEVEQDV